MRHLLHDSALNGHIYLVYTSLTLGTFKQTVPLDVPPLKARCSATVPWKISTRHRSGTHVFHAGPAGRMLERMPMPVELGPRNGTRPMYGTSLARVIGEFFLEVFGW